MAAKNKDEYNAYMRDYMLRRYRRRRNEAIKLLGGKCIRCGSLENLELDHVDPETKEYDLAKVWSYAVEKFRNEIKKCQLLCRACHTAKTLVDLGRESARGKHGTVSSYRYCRCLLCKGAKKQYNKDARIRRVAK